MSQVLESWKEIAAYLGRSVRAVQLWEKDENLPVHRHQHDKQGTVFAYRDEIDRWRESRTAAPVPASRPRRYLLPAVLIAAVVVAIAIVVLRGSATRRDVHSIAVLPFTGDIEHVTDGLTELLIDELATMKDVRVMARSSVFRYKNVSPARAGKELDVGAVVTGDVRRENDRYVVHVELIDARDGAQLWAHRYEATSAELPSMQHLIFADLSSKLSARERTATNYTANAKAYEEYLLGLREWNRRSSGGRRNKEALASALQHFQSAIRLDPKFAAAYAGLANTYGVMVGLHDVAPAEGTLHVLAAARKALELDPNNAEALTSIATSTFKNLRDFDSAERDYRRAIALNPSFATTHQWYGEFLQAMGRFDEARREIELAYRLDPLSAPITSDMCRSYYYERRYRDAIRFARDVEARDPQRAPVWCINASLLALGELEAYRRDGPRAYFQTRLQNALNRPDANAVELARDYAMAGDKDHAFASLETALARGDSESTMFHLEPELDPLRDDPRFADLARRAGLPASAIEATHALAAKQGH